MPLIRFFVPGIPAPGGSKRAFVIQPKDGGKPRVNVVEDCKRNKPWRQTVTFYTRAAHKGPRLEGPLALEVSFVMPRPKNHFGTGKNIGKLKAAAPRWHTVKPDRTKLLRALEDAITDAGIWRDDTQVVRGRVEKRYECGVEDSVGAYVSIYEVE